MMFGVNDNLWFPTFRLPQGQIFHCKLSNHGCSFTRDEGSFPLLSALQIVGVLKITPYSYPWLEVDIGKIMCPLFLLFKIWKP